MAVRALIPAERLNIAHVNSVDGSTDYESGTEYKAGTVVTYNSNTYVANIDIADTDTDTPDSSPDKWGLCPNAKSLVEGGEVADLENRVAALEAIAESLGTASTHDITNDIVSGSEDVLTTNGAYAALEKKLAYKGLTSGANQLFDVLSDNTTYPEGVIYTCYAANIQVGVDDLNTLLSLSQYAHVEICKYGTYLETIKVFSTGGNCAFAYASPSDNHITFGVFKPDGNDSIVINKPV